MSSNSKQVKTILVKIITTFILYSATEVANSRKLCSSVHLKYITKITDVNLKEVTIMVFIFDWFTKKRIENYFLYRMYSDLNTINANVENNMDEDQL